MTNAEAWEAYRAKRPVLIGAPWKQGGQIGPIVKTHKSYSEAGNGIPGIWFGVRPVGGILRWYGAEQLREVEA